MSSERDDRDDSNTGGGAGTHGGLAIGRTTGMGAGVAKGGTPGAGDTDGGGTSKGGASKGGASKDSAKGRGSKGGGRKRSR